MERKQKPDNDTLISKGSVPMSSSIGEGREKAFYSSLGLLIILNVIIKPLWIFGIDRQVQNTVGTEIYGTYFSLLNFSIVFSFLLDWGVSVYVNRQLAANDGNFSNRTGSYLFIKLFFAILYAVIVSGVAVLSGIRNWNILGSVIVIQVLTSGFVFLRSMVTAKQWFKTDAGLSVLDKALMILVCGGFLWFPSLAGEMTISRFLLIQIICTALAVSVVLIVLLKRGFNFSFRIKTLPKLQLLKSVLPFAVIIFLMSMHYRLDGFLLERIHTNGAYEAGLYAGAYRLLDAANMIGYLVASFLLPFIARQWNTGKSINEVVLFSRHLLMLFSIVVIVTTVFLAPWIQETLYHKTDPEAVTILQWCLPALLGYSLVQVYGTVLTATGQVIPFCYIVLLSVVLNIILNLLLIPAWGALGCCFASVASQSFCGITALLYVQKKSGINIRYHTVLMYIFMAAILSCYYYGLKDTAISKGTRIIGAGIITLAGAIFFKLIDIRKWRIMITQKNH
ncbi:MAG: polysaccharide biosynthesis C-terminal domain-containing protein [Chitinophagaceae bacterium]|nr:polysaccharide biosynthesis C-terminal domain-containing protein [Chitinophagaceae bacterium]